MSIYEARKWRINPHFNLMKVFFASKEIAAKTSSASFLIDGVLLRFEKQITCQDCYKCPVSTCNLLEDQKMATEFNLEKSSPQEVGSDTKNLMKIIR